MITSNTIVNQAIVLIGDNQPVVNGEYPNFDSSPAGVAANQLYAWVVRTSARQAAWDFSRNTSPLTPSGRPAPFPWSVEYLYPVNAVQIWQLSPLTLDDPNDPLPVNWAVANTLVGDTQTKVIHTDLVNAQAIYDNLPNESTWDPGFQEVVVRLLSSELASALAGRLDTSQSYLENSSAISATMQERDS